MSIGGPHEVLPSHGSGSQADKRQIGAGVDVVRPRATSPAGSAPPGCAPAGPLKRRRRVPPHAAPDYPYRDLMAFRAAISEVRCRCNR